jgi:ferric-dicitrate binding protein FerR (iron transport regulator)
MTDPSRYDFDIEAAVRLADESLAPSERAAAEARLRATAAGRQALEQQQRVVRALRAAGPAAPPDLRAGIEAQAARPRRRGIWLRLGARRWR